MTRAMLVACMFLVAGCADVQDAARSSGTCDCEVEGLADGRDIRTGLTANDTLPAPRWDVGTVFEQHMFFGAADTDGQHFTTVVVDAQDGYTVATPDQDAAAWAATFDYPILGHLGTGLETTAFGSDWSWMYDWPLHDGKTWTATLEDALNMNSFNRTDHELTLTATYAPAIETALGPRPGFLIEAKAEAVLLRYDYVPAIGWFSDLSMYDLETPDPDDTQFRARNMGVRYGYEGDYWLADATVQVEAFYGHFPNPYDPTTLTYGDPVPEAFTIPEGSARMMGVVVPIATAGHSEVQLTGPGETRSYVHQQALDGPGATVHFVDEAAVPGDWQAHYVPAAVWAGAYIELSSVSLEARAM